MSTINMVSNFAKAEETDITSVFYVDATLSNNSKLRFTLDTGAVVTVLPVDENLLELQYNIKPTDVFVDDKCIQLSTASGQKLLAYFTIFSNVRFGGLKLDKFCCYLTKVPMETALLGRDFIIASSLHHALFASNFDLLAIADNDEYIKRCIKIFKVLRAKYGVSSSSNDIIDGSNVASTNNSNEQAKDVSAAFRDLYSKKYNI